MAVEVRRADFMYFLPVSGLKAGLWWPRTRFAEGWRPPAGFGGAMALSCPLEATTVAKYVPGQGIRADRRTAIRAGRRPREDQGCRNKGPRAMSTFVLTDLANDLWVESFEHGPGIAGSAAAGRWSVRKRRLRGGRR